MIGQNQNGIGKKRLSVDIPSNLHKQLKQLSLEQDTTVRELVVRALEEQYRQCGDEYEVHNARETEKNRSK